MMITTDPCKNCRRVAHPADCENMRCARWRSYFLYRWGLIHRKGLELKKGAEQ